MGSPPTIHSSLSGSWRSRAGTALSSASTQVAPSDTADWVLAVMEALGGSKSFLREVHQLLTQDGLPFHRAVSKLNQKTRTQLESRVGKGNFEKILSISREPSREFFFQDLLCFARDLRLQGRDARAAAVFQLLDQEIVGLELRQEAKREFQAMAGEGSFGRRAEYLGQRFVHGATNYKMIVPMLAGSTMYNVGRAVTMGRLAILPQASWLSSSWGRRAVAGMMGFLLEAPTFALSARYLHQISGEPVRDSVGHDLLSAGLTLGLFKIFGWAGEGAFQGLRQAQRLHAGSQFTKQPAFGRPLFSQAAQFLGLLVAHRVEEELGLRPPSQNATSVADALASFVSLGVGGNLGYRILGPNFEAFQHEMNFRSETSSSPSSRARIQYTLPLGEVQKTRDISRRSANPRLDPIWRMAASGELDGPLSPPKTRRRGVEYITQWNQPTWAKNPEVFRETVKLIFENSLGGDPEKITTGPSFFPARFRLPSGEEVSGFQILSAMLSFEKPGMSKDQGFKALGGNFRVVQLFKEKYLGLTAWDQSRESVEQALQYILKNLLNGDPAKICTSQSFRAGEFLLPDGTTVSGNQLILAVSSLERPDKTREDSLAALGGNAAVIRIIKENYLKVSSWDETPQKLRETIEYVLNQHLGSDPSRISSGVFNTALFTLPDGKEISGGQILRAVAQFERPGVVKEQAYKDLGGVAQVVRILKENYLPAGIDQGSWDQSIESLRETLAFLFQGPLEGDLERINTSKFLKSFFVLPRGRRVSGFQILSAVAGFERPGLLREEAIKAIGGIGQVLEILKQKYLGIFVPRRTWDQDSQSLQKTIEHIYQNALGGDAAKISATPSFLEVKFELVDGTRVSGYQLLRAVAQIENPNMTKSEAMRALGGQRKVIRIILEKYLHLSPEEQARVSAGIRKPPPPREKKIRPPKWQTSKWIFKGEMRSLLQTQLEGDARRISAESFPHESFTLSDGTTLSGSQILAMVAGFEKLEISEGEDPASHAEAVKVFQERYLGYSPPRRLWDHDPASLKNAIHYIYHDLLQEDARRISVGPKFIQGKFLLPEGVEVNGGKIMRAVAKFEMPGMNKEKTIKLLGGPAKIVRILKEKYLGLFVELPSQDKKRDRVDFPLRLNFEIKDSPSELEVGEILKAIVAQDRELYPDGDARKISTHDKNFHRRYGTGDRTLGLSTLVGWTRSARGIRSGDTRTLPNSEIIAEWKKNVFGLEESVEGFPLRIDFELPETPSEHQVHEIVKAIVAQDHQFYPQGDASRIGVGEKRRKRRYRVGDRSFAFSTLFNWVRIARGIKALDNKALGDGKIRAEWRRRLFGIEKVRGIAIRVGLPPEKIPKKKRSLEVGVGFEKNISETEIDEIVKAIVAQDHELYPDQDARRMSASPEYIGIRYNLDGRSFGLITLFQWVRRSRGIKARAFRELPNGTIVKEWQKRLFGIEPEIEGFPLSIDLPLKEELSEAEIGRFLKAIVSQDNELYPDQDAKDFSTHKKFLSRRYRIGDKSFALHTLIGRYRKAKGFKAEDDKALPISTVVSDWKRKFFGISEEVEGFPIQLNFELSETPTEAEIDEIVKAIVAQDGETYPNQDARDMSTSAKFDDRRYRLGELSFSLHTLIGWVRMARGYKSADIRALPASSVVTEWKRRLFQIEKEIVGFPIRLNFELSKKPTEAEIAEIVKAIVAQDSELFPGQDARKLTTYYKNMSRVYRIRDQSFRFAALLGWVRRARGMKANDIQALSNSAIAREWQEKIFGILAPLDGFPLKIRKKKEPSEGFPLKIRKIKKETREEIDLQYGSQVSESPTEEEINEIVRAIVEQDREIYPEQDAGPMSTNEKYLLRRYRIEDESFCLQTLCGWVRQARGLRSTDKKPLPDPIILREWKRNLFGIEKEQPRGIPIQLSFELSESPTEAEIGEVVKAIVAQDSEQYPEQHARDMSTFTTFFSRRYQIGTRFVTLDGLARGVRRARGLKGSDSKSLSELTILKEWKQRLFGIEKAVEGLPIQLDFELSENPTEKEIGEVVRAIVAQDGELYPGQDAQKLVASKPCLFRQYRVGDQSLTFYILICKIRRLRGLMGKDVKVLPEGAVLREWKEKLFGIEERRDGMPLNVKLDIKQQLREEEIENIVRAIVMQDSELYPDQDGNRLSLARQITSRRYRIGDVDFTLHTLFGRVRQARGFKASDQKALPITDILRHWKEKLFGIKEEKEGFPLRLDFELSENFTEEEIGKIVQAIVAQDDELYPEQDARKLVLSKKNIERLYQFGDRFFKLNNLLSSVRRARGLKADDTRALPNSKIFAEWKRKLFGIEEKVVGFPLQLGFELSESPTEEEIEEIVKAIVAQDHENYPRQEAERMTSSKKYLDRRYHVGEQSFALYTLCRWFRRARGLKDTDTRSLPDSLVFKIWKARLWGIVDLKSRDRLETFLSKHGREEILDFFSEHPNLLIEASTYFRDGELQTMDGTPLVWPTSLH